MELRPYEYRDPGELLAAVVAERALCEGDMLLALVCDPSSDQQVVHTIGVDRADRPRLDSYGGPEILRAHLQRLPVPARRRGKPPRHSVMTITARRGLTVFGPAEIACLSAWRYSNHLIDVFVGDLMVVTEHGWADFMTGWGGPEPRLRLP